MTVWVNRFVAWYYTLTVGAISQFRKSLTAYADHRAWQDVYHVPSPVGMLYVKFTADTVSEFLPLSFKETADD